MVQFKTLAFFLIATTATLPTLAAPFNTQESEDLFSREYDDGLVERDISMAVEPLLTREFSDVEAREPGFLSGIGNAFKKIFLGRRELDDNDDILSRDYILEENLD